METESRTLGALYERYVKLQCLAKPTEERYWLSARNLAKHLGGDHCSPNSINVQAINADVLATFRKSTLLRTKAVTFNTERAHLAVLFNFAVRTGWMDSNPFREVKRAPVATRAPKALPKREMTTYIDLLKTGYRLDAKARHTDLLPPQWFWLTVVQTFYMTAMRKRQLIGLLWGDIDFLSQTVNLRSDTSKTRREWKIPIPDALVPPLRELHRRTVQIRGNAINDKQVFCLPLFSTSSNFSHRTMTADVLDNFFQRLRKAVPREMGRLSAHCIRHTTATILANSVPNLKLVQEQLGHTSIMTTYGYVHADLSAMKKALDVL